MLKGIVCWINPLLRGGSRISRKIGIALSASSPRRKYFRTCEKMGIKVAKTFNKMYKLDQQNGNSCLLCGDDLYDRRQGI